MTNKGAQIYFGENLSDYVITGAKQDEFNYARQGVSDSQTRYTGKDGVKLSNIFRKAAFALKFRDFNLFVSGQVGLELEDPDGARHPRPGAQARAVPQLRRRPVPGGGRRPDAVGSRRLHHLRPVPVLPERVR